LATAFGYQANSNTSVSAMSESEAANVVTSSALIHSRRPQARLAGVDSMANGSQTGGVQ
jgi:hypothetical protein